MIVESDAVCDAAANYANRVKAIDRAMCPWSEHTVPSDPAVPANVSHVGPSRRECAPCEIGAARRTRWADTARAPAWPKARAPRTAPRAPAHFDPPPPVPPDARRAPALARRSPAVPAGADARRDGASAAVEVTSLSLAHDQGATLSSTVMLYPLSGVGVGLALLAAPISTKMKDGRGYSLFVAPWLLPFTSASYEGGAAEEFGEQDASPATNAF